MAGRLRRSDCASPGISRRRRGKGFEYLDEDGKRIGDEEVIERIRALAIPPAWEDVWICSDPLGHIQATGTDVRGRKQYRYHDLWRERRDRQKFDSMTEFARSLPKLRGRVERDLRKRSISRDRVLACAVRLLDRGFFRIGSEDYAEENETYGLATMRKRHLKVTGDSVVFDYEAKGGKRRVQTVGDPAISGLVKTLRSRRGGGHELLAYRNGSTWRDTRSPEINDYIQETIGEGHSAKDFRTWNATVLAAVVLAGSARERDLSTKGGRARAQRDAVKQRRGSSQATARRPRGVAGGAETDRGGRARPHRPAFLTRDRAGELSPVRGESVEVAASWGEATRATRGAPR